MLEELHTVLVPYLQGAPVKETACLLPVLAAQVRVYADNDTFLRAIIDRYLSYYNHYINICVYNRDADFDSVNQITLMFLYVT